jgi:hypothetical protein
MARKTRTPAPLTAEQAELVALQAAWAAEDAAHDAMVVAKTRFRASVEGRPMLELCAIENANETIAATGYETAEYWDNAWMTAEIMQGEVVG